MTAPGYDPNNPWMARNVSWMWSQYYATRTFTVAPGSTHTLTIQGMGNVSNPSLTNQVAFLDAVQVTSVDALFAGGMPVGGQAAGQPTGGGYQTTLDGEANWAAAYGLQELSYEGGWSLGGDDGGSPLQLAAKFGDARTAAVQAQALDMFTQAGSSISVLGTYAQWQDWSDYTAQQGLTNIDQSPIVQGVDNRLDSLPAAPNNGIGLPATLRPSTITLGLNANLATGQIASAGGWVDWNVLVTAPGAYTIALSTTGNGGMATLLADDRAIAAGATGGSLSGTVTLAVGMHTIEVRGGSSAAFCVSQVTVVSPGAPGTPTVTSHNAGDGTVALAWSAVSGATGYRVSYGTNPGSPTSSVRFGAVTQGNLSGLADGQAYYFAVSAIGPQGESLPAAPVGAIPQAAGATGPLALWEFAGASGNATTAGVSAAIGPVAVGSLSRGPGLVPSTSAWGASLRAGRFASEPAKSNYAADLSGAIAAGQYYQFTLAPASGTTLSVSSIAFRPYFQGGVGAAGLTYSTDGATFSTGIAAVGSASNPGSAWTVDLSGRADLRGTAATVTIRIYLYGMGSFEVSGLGSSIGTDLVVSGVSQVPTPTQGTTSQAVKAQAGSTATAPATRQVIAAPTPVPAGPVKLATPKAVPAPASPIKKI